MTFANELAVHTIVIVVAKRERGVALETLLKRFGYRTFVAMNLYDAQKIIEQEMPHLVITESVLTDGNAGNLHDKLKVNAILKKTPILVNVLKKTKEELSPLQNRKFVGFLLGALEPKTVMAKVKEVLAAHAAVSPHFEPIEKHGINGDVLVSIEAVVMGRKGEQLVVRSDTEFDPGASLLCAPQAPGLAPAVLRNATSVREGNELFNLFPLNRIVGQGRQWIEKLPDLYAGAGAASSASSDKPSKRVLFFEPNQARFDGFAEILKGYGFDLVHAKTTSMSASFLKREPTAFGCVYLHELVNDASGIEWKKVHGGIPPSERPNIIVGTSAINAKSTEEMRYIKRPFGLGQLVEILEVAFERGSDVAAVAGKDAQTAVATNPVHFQAQAKLVGLDETGGVLITKFPIHSNSRLHLGHDFLKEVWGGDTSVTIQQTTPVPGKSDQFHLRFCHLPAGMSKAKYWEKIIEILERRTAAAAS